MCLWKRWYLRKSWTSVLQWTCFSSSTYEFFQFIDLGWKTHKASKSRTGPEKQSILFDSKYVFLQSQMPASVRPISCPLCFLPLPTHALSKRTHDQLQYTARLSNHPSIWSQILVTSGLKGSVIRYHRSFEKSQSLESPEWAVPWIFWSKIRWNMSKIPPSKQLVFGCIGCLASTGTFVFISSPSIDFCWQPDHLVKCIWSTPVCPKLWIEFVDHKDW